MTEIDYDKDVLDIDEVSIDETKINPDYYIHNAILKTQQALIKDDFEKGLLQYLILIDHVEILAKASSRLPSDYEVKIKNYLAEISAPTNLSLTKTADLPFMIKIAHKKIELILTSCFKNKTSTDPLSFDKKTKAIIEDISD
jgi:hypothetical protein